MENEEEKRLEEEALAKIDETKIREDIISEFGFDEIDQSELIDKAVAREVKNRTLVAKAIGSKIKTRTELEELRKTPKTANNVDPDELDKKLDAKLNERLESRDLDSMDYPDELRAEIKKVAQIQGVSVKKALSDPYIQSKIELVEKERRTEEASTNRTNKSGGKSQVSMDNPPNVDMATPEGQKEWEKYKDELRKQYPNTGI